MNSRKRQASDPLLPLRSSKLVRASNPELLPAQPARWFDQLVKIGRDTLSYFALFAQEPDSEQFGLPSSYLPPSRFRTPDAQSTSSASSRCHRSLAPPPSTPAVTRKRRPTTPTSPTRTGQRTSISPNALSRHLSPPFMSSTRHLPSPVPASKSKPIRPGNGETHRSCSLGESLLASHPSFTLHNPPNHIYSESRPASESLQGPIPSSSQTSSIPSGRSDPTLTTHSVATLSTAVASTITTKGHHPHSLSVNGSQLSIDQTLDSAMRTYRSKGSFHGIPRTYQNKEHIYAKQHKSAISTQRKKDREDMIKELYELKRSVGYASDFATFQGYLDYGERLLLLETRGALSPSPSLTDLRSRNRTPAPSRRHSISGDFLERALEKAREALNGPRPPKPFHPSLDQLQISARAKDEEIERRLRGSKRSRLPDRLPAEDEAEVDSFLSMRGVVSKFAREQVTDRDLSRLKPGQWLNDEIINFYGQLIMSQSDACKENPSVNGVNGVKIIGKKKMLNVHYFSTFFWSKLKGEGYEKGRLAKWTKKFDLFQKDVVLVPVNHNNSHWSAAAINFRRQRIESYDSMNMERRDVYKLLRAYLDAEHRNKKKKPFDFTGWEDHIIPDTPQQENGYDCGVFTCQFLASLARGEETFNFCQANMSYIRRRMIWEICHATLRDATT